MSVFELKKHVVEKALFIENNDREKKKDIDVVIDGGILVPKDINESKTITVNMTFSFGKEDERIYFLVKTLSSFEICGEFENGLNEEVIQKQCVPIAMESLRKTVNDIMKAYGRPEIKMPPFEL